MLTAWYLIVGAALAFMVFFGTVLDRLPISGAIVYLLIGVALGPAGFNLLRIDPLQETALFHAVTEIAVLISLFGVGLKLRERLGSPLWRAPVVLATATMTVTIAMIALMGVGIFSMSLGAAVLLGAVLAPTDPVLASEVQVRHPHDRDDVRFALSAEGGMNDGAAFPFVMLALGLLGAHELGAWGWQWVTVDLLWAVSIGLGSGSLTAYLIGSVVLYLRRRHGEALGEAQFLTLALIALAYGVALALHSYGFLAVFAAGLTLRHMERRTRGAEQALAHIGADADAAEVHPRAAPAHLTHTVLGFNAQLEKMVEFAVVLCLGIMLSSGYFVWPGLVLAGALFLLVRPIAVLTTLGTLPMARSQLILVSWFGIRGIGSIYYVLYATDHGLPSADARQVGALALTVVAASIVLHGLSATPLMAWYDQRRAKLRNAS